MLILEILKNCLFWILKFVNGLFFVLLCFLVNIVLIEFFGWLDEVIVLMRENVCFNYFVSVRVMGKCYGMLFIDFVILKDLF